MARWEPDSPGRLELAALELFEERGYEQTTVEEIAARAGLTKRTFFRHYGDKREVLFGGGDALATVGVEAIGQAPAGTPAMEAAAVGLAAIGEVLQARRAFASRRAKIITANPPLLERELAKLAAMASATAAALRERGVEEPQASLVAESAMAVFRVAFDRWASARTGDLPTLIRESLDALRAATATGS